IWDAGGALVTHQEFGGRASIMDGALVDHHSTYVAGIIGSAGIVPAARGMATSVTMQTYNWYNDDAEMLAAAAAISGDPGKVYVSNHSYGDSAGWEQGAFSGNVGRHFFGEWDASPPVESDLFGQYSEKAAVWDD